MREALPRQIDPAAAAWVAQDAELDAEIAALEAVGALTVPAEEKLPGLALAPDDVPPHRLQTWLADLSGSPFDEDLTATTDATGRKTLTTGRPGHARYGAVGFASGEAADLLSPGAALAALTEDAHAAGLTRLTDDELAGVIRAGHRLASWASALELAAVSDLMRRREQQEADGHRHAAEHADAELAALLTLTGRGAGRVLDLAIALRRLPLTAQALAAGVIDLHRMAVIADETTGLDDDHTAAAERQILVRAPGQTTSQLRAAARRAVLAADPRAARKRKEQAQREARVERWDEHAGTAALAGRDLPPAAVIAADQHISALARGLRAAGLAGTADQLRAQVFLALLSGVPASAMLPTGQQRPDWTASGSGASVGPGVPGPLSMPGNLGMAGSPTICDGRETDVPRTSSASGWPSIPAVAGTVNLTMPLSTWLGLPDVPGEVTGFGPLTADDSRRLGAAMAGHPRTQWCVTLTGEDGRPVAHGCARRGCGPPGPPYSACAPPPRSPAPQDQGPAPPRQGPSPPEQGPAPPKQEHATPTRTLAAPAQGCALSTQRPGPPEHRPAPLASDPMPSSDAEADVAAWLGTIRLKWFESDCCKHQRRSMAYRPPAGLQHLIRVRQQACAFPGCRRPASQCDLDHTTPFQRGGLTCECNLAPLCRRHHEAKQAPGWSVEQSRPGVLSWTIPSGRTYSTRPTVYPG